MKSKKVVYYCDGICERCNKGKEFKSKSGTEYSCDPAKVRGLRIIAPYLVK